MAHGSQQSFCESMSCRYPGRFNGCKVLEIGSLNVNGTVRDFFKGCDYTGVDIVEGKDVDVVSLCHELEYEDGSFDTIISAECFEHDPFIKESLSNILRMLKVGGLFVFTCGTTGRPEHGTIRSTGPSEIYGPDSTYYKNLVEADFRSISGWDEMFPAGIFTIQSNDIYFCGVKELNN